MVSIMPGMERAAPERTETSSGSLGSPSFLPVDFLQLGDVLLAPPSSKPLGNLLAELVVLVAGVDADGEAGGDGQADGGHLMQALALAAEDILGQAAAFGLAGAVEVNAFRHRVGSPEKKCKQADATCAPFADRRH